MTESIATVRPPPTSLRKTPVANYVAAAIAAVAPLLALPFYVNALGPEGWGLVSFAMTLAATVGMLEVGISQRLVRDLVLLAHREACEFPGVARAVEAYYWAAAILLGGTIAFFATFIADQWLNLPASHKQQGHFTVYFCAMLLLTQVPNAAYRSILVATDRQVPLCAHTALVNLVKHGGGVWVVTHQGELRDLYLFLGVIALLDVATRKWIARPTHSTAVGTGRVDWAHARTLLMSGMRVSFAVVTGIFALQLDRLYLSRLGSLNDLGTYSIAASLAYGALQLSAPLISAVAPRLAISSIKQSDLDQMCRKLIAGMLLAITGAGVAYIGLGEHLVAQWLKDPATFERLQWTLRLLLVGTGLNAVYQVGYQRWIAQGETRHILRVNMLALIAAAVLTPVAISAFGIIGASAAWLSFNVAGLCFQARWLLSLALPRSRSKQ